MTSETCNMREAEIKRAEQMDKRSILIGWIVGLAFWSLFWLIKVAVRGL